MNPKTIMHRKKTAPWIILGIIALSVLILFIYPIRLAAIVMPANDTTINRIVISEANLQDKPQVVTIDDSDMCENLLACFRDNYAQWRFFNRSTIVQDHGTLYSLYIYCSDGSLVECRLSSDKKLYCGHFCYGLSDNVANELLECILDALSPRNAGSNMVLTEGTYVPTNNTDIDIEIEFDLSNNRFSIKALGNDFMSGKVKIVDGKVSAKTDDERFEFVFEVENDETIYLVSDESDTLIVNNGDSQLDMSTRRIKFSLLKK